MPRDANDADDAFTEAYRSHRIEQGDDPSTLPPPLKRRKTTGGGRGSNAATGADAGGFLPDSSDEGEDDQDDDENGPVPGFLPLAEVPHALSILSLPTDDDGILSVFRSAAINDPSAPRRRPGGEPLTKVISREDFLRVCEVLLEDTKGGEDEEEERADDRRRRRPTGRPSRLAAAKQRRAVQDQMEAESISSDSEDAYHGSEDEDEGDDDDDEEEEAPATKASSSRRRRKRAADSEDEEGRDDSKSALAETAITQEQRDIAQGAWQLLADKLEEIYPDWDGQSIGKKELHRLAISVGEKLNDKDVSMGEKAMGLIGEKLQLLTITTHLHTGRGDARTCSLFLRPRLVQVRYS
ncbi:hypothetical protein BDZ90DRAFT_144643 [Jaminaea rosea]|uniref:Uncharacterized protein n=1 Tax=Jaminaea rosea TaxID=1569628 RepID=A0A316UTH9_9BASI|nr:hypothetical protein BDZ90DRAFT_144643 [Jaminaea rosea]PWN28304.1 hypothetical protein BDZ90DRAFT_144643 [Jaminaea rosea]